MALAKKIVATKSMHQGTEGVLQMIKSHDERRQRFHASNDYSKPEVEKAEIKRKLREETPAELSSRLKQLSLRNGDGLNHQSLQRKKHYTLNLPSREKSPSSRLTP